MTLGVCDAGKNSDNVEFFSLLPELFEDKMINFSH